MRYFIVALLLLAACSGTNVSFDTYAINGLQFDYPAGWTITPDPHSAMFPGLTLTSPNADAFVLEHGQYRVNIQFLSTLQARALGLVVEPDTDALDIADMVNQVVNDIGETGVLTLPNGTDIGVVTFEQRGNLALSTALILDGGMLKVEGLTGDRKPDRLQNKLLPILASLDVDYTQAVANLHHTPLDDPGETTFTITVDDQTTVVDAPQWHVEPTAPEYNGNGDTFSLQLLGDGPLRIELTNLPPRPHGTYELQSFGQAVGMFIRTDARDAVVEGVLRTQSDGDTFFGVFEGTAPSEAVSIAVNGSFSGVPMPNLDACVMTGEGGAQFTATSTGPAARFHLSGTYDDLYWRARTVSINDDAHASGANPNTRLFLGTHARMHQHGVSLEIENLPYPPVSGQYDVVPGHGSTDGIHIIVWKSVVMGDYHLTTGTIDLQATETEFSGTFDITVNTGTTEIGATGDAGHISGSFEGVPILAANCNLP